MNQKERVVCEQLKKWFNRYNIDCWLNFGNDKFITKDCQKKPDLIIYSKKLNQYIALEVKPGDISKDIHDASKIIEYWEDYTNGKIEYFIDEKKINISSFCVATISSMFGKIFKDDDNLLSIDDSNDAWKRTNKLYGLEPLWEYRRTHDYLRGLWSQWRKKRKREQQPGIGIILSVILNSKEIPTDAVSSPLMFDMQWETSLKPQWKVRQKNL